MKRTQPYLLYLSAIFILSYITVANCEESSISLIFKAEPIMECDDTGQLMKETAILLEKRFEAFLPVGVNIKTDGVDKFIVELPTMPEGLFGEKIMDIFQKRGHLEFIIAAEVNMEFPKKLDMLIKYLLKCERNEGCWGLETDLSGLSFSMLQEDFDVSYQWMPWPEDYICGEKRLQLPLSGNTFESLGIDVETNPEWILSYFTLVKRYGNTRWRFTNDDLASVGPGIDSMQNPALRFEFKKHRKNDFKEFTKKHINKRLCIVLDNRIISAPVINDAIPGFGIISGPQPCGFDLGEANELITYLRTGHMKMALELISLESKIFNKKDDHQRILDELILDVVEIIEKYTHLDFKSLPIMYLPSWDEWSMMIDQMYPDNDDKSLMKVSVLGRYFPSMAKIVLNPMYWGMIEKAAEDREFVPVDFLSSLCHELVHALQDQHFGLCSCLKDEKNLDRARVMKYIGEGHAVFITEVYAEHRLGIKNYFLNHYDLNYHTIASQKYYYYGRNYIKRIFLNHDMEKVNSILGGDYPNVDTLLEVGGTNPDDED